MPIQSTAELFPISEVVVSSRQRTTVGDVSGLEESIRRAGQINPIIITRKGELIAGERRLRAMQNLKHQFILVRFLEDLDPYTRQLIELDENTRRLDLPWKDLVAAVARYHELRVSHEEGWNIQQSAEALGRTADYVRRQLNIARALADGNERVAAADSMKSAENILERELTRQVQNELSQLESIEDSDDKNPQSSETSSSAPGTRAEAPAARTLSRPASDDILHGDFVEWASTYSGRRFNFLHCDFPYGINHHKSDQGGAAEWGSYSDSPDVYWHLVRTLISNQDRILYPSAHAIFWFSMNFYQETLVTFSEAGWFVVPHPLIWMKSDSRGIASDVERRPKHIYETAFFMSRGDRRIISPIGDAYAAPTAKSLHQSEKPEPVLRHFMRLGVDGMTEILDPTCGSGSALRAAEALGAKRVLGLELNPEYRETAVAALQRARNLATLTEKL